MPQDAPPNGSAQDPVPQGPWSRVAGMQAKLHRWAVADPGRQFVSGTYNQVSAIKSDLAGASQQSSLLIINPESWAFAR